MRRVTGVMGRNFVSFDKIPYVSLPLQTVYPISFFSMSMRLHCFLSPNTERVPFSYQHTITRRIHQVFPNNTFHDDVSLYSFSWLHSGRALQKDGGLDFPHGAEWFVSFADESNIRDMLAAFLRDSTLFFGMKIKDVKILDTPTFPSTMRFFAASPILVKHFDGATIRHHIYTDTEADTILTQTLRTKLRKAGLPDEATVRFDRSAPNAKTKLVDIHGIKNRANMCPVIVEGSPEAVAFAWNVGVGHSTGVGFGALR